MTDLAVALPAYLVFVLAAVVLPGIALQRLARVPVDPALVIPLGQAAVACAYGGCLVLGVPQAAWVAVLLLDGAVLWNRGGGGRAGPALRGALPAVLALIAVLALTRYPLNRLTAAGDFVLDPLAEADTALHAGMTWELTHGYPPQVPGLSGVQLHYHLGAPLVRAAATRFAGIGPYDLLTRFQPTLDGIALILVLRSVVHAMGGGPLAVALAGWAPLAGDFAFLFVAHSAMRYWTDFLHGNVLLAVLLGNNVIPALACAMGSLVALHRATEDRRRGWLALSCALAAATPLFKIFVGAHLGLALGAMLLRPFTRRAALAPVSALLAAAAMMAGGGGPQTIRVAVEPLVPVGEALPNWPYAAWAVAWVVASIGPRWLGVPLAVASVRSRRPLPFAVGVMALSGWVIGLLLHITARDTMPGMKAFNQASYFLEQGGLLLWTFTALQLGKTLAASPRLVLVAPLAALVAFADTAQFVARKQERPVKHVPADVLRGMAALAAASRPGDVVLQRADPRFPPPPVVFIGRRVPYTRVLPYLPQFAPRAELEARLHAVRAFFSTTDPQAALAIAAGLRARYLCLYDEDRVLFPPRAVLQPIYEGPQTRVYRVLW